MLFDSDFYNLYESALKYFLNWPDLHRNELCKWYDQCAISER